MRHASSVRSLLTLLGGVAFAFAAVAQDVPWQETQCGHVAEGYQGGYSEEEIVTLAAQKPVEDDVLHLHEAFVATWQQARQQDADLSLGGFIIEAEICYHALAQAGGASTQSVRSRGTTGGF